MNALFSAFIDVTDESARATYNPRARQIRMKEHMTDDFLTLDASAPSEDEAPAYLLDEIEAELDDDDLDLTAEAPLSTDSLQQFLNEAGRYPLLTAAEEVEL